ncbi:MAG TPA: BadF/BadG/BcrA/BcrD ATPase family protein [Candidatus Sulfotelmatobacter sp.]|nr:BadF/BadG/BcrA/BcrD ATPase family protein [Candidatus Sulfotelmatobacter sp.]
MRYVAGIDGGQSSTLAVVVAEDGRIVGRGAAGPAAHVDEPPGSHTAADAVGVALAAALVAAGLAADAPLAAVRIGLSGWDQHFDGAAPTLRAGSVRMCHDATIALAGAIPARPAAVVIAGTGSVAYGEDAAGRGLRIGGWGYLFGDAGSAFAVARDALAAAMLTDDAGGRHPLGDAALAFYDRPDLRALATAAIQGRLSRATLAGFARVVFDAARLGDADAAAIVDRAADALAELAATLLARLGLDQPAPVAFIGGLLANADFRARVGERLGRLVPQAVVVEPLYEPAAGAALLAFDDAALGRPARLAPA